jgi:hypothetical protein
MDSWINEFHGRDAVNDIPGGQQGYGVSIFGACHGIRVTDCSVVGGRHAFTTNGIPTTGGVCARHVTVKNFFATGLESAAFDTHQGNRYIQFEDCKAFGSFGGFQLRSPDCSIINADVSHCQSGIFITGAGTNYGHNALVRGGRFRNLERRPIYIVGADDVVVDGPVISDCRSTNSVGIYTGRESEEEEATASNRTRITNVHISNMGGKVEGKYDGYGLYFDAGDGHSYDNIWVDGVEHAVRMDEPCTNLGHGKIRGRNLTQFFHPHVPASITSPPDIAGTGSPESVWRGPPGTIFRRTDGSGSTLEYIKGSGNTTTGWKPRPTVGTGTDDAAPGPAWHAIRQSSPGLAAATTTGKYLDNIAIASSNTSGTSYISPVDLKEVGNKFKLRAKYRAEGGAADPTSTLRVSVYEVSEIKAEAAGPVYVLGSEVSASAVTPIITTRGKIADLESSEFELNSSKGYAVILELATANLPASVAVRGNYTLSTRGTP